MGKLIEAVTNGGTIPLLSPTLNDAKIKRADQIIEGVRKGDRAALAEFAAHFGGVRYKETVTTGDDFIWAFAQLTAKSVTDEWEETERTWSEVIETDTITSFDAPTNYYIDAAVEGFERPVNEPGKPGNIVPIVPEGSPYPAFQFSGELAESGSIHKAGGQYQLTFEKIINDIGGIVPKIPVLIRDSLLQREEWDAWSGLISILELPANALAAGDSLLGTTVPANAPLSREALEVALVQAGLREVRGKKVRVGSYALIVPTGGALQANFLLNNVSVTGQEVAQSSSVTNVVSFNGWSPLSKITKVVESDFMPDGSWALVPNKGAIRGPKFYALTRLRGHEGPELRVQNLTGNYLGGGAVPPFEGSFDTDSAAFRGRIINGGIGWNTSYPVFSDGSGS